MQQNIWNIYANLKYSLIFAHFDSPNTYDLPLTENIVFIL